MTREEIIKSALKFLVLKQTEQGSWGYSDRNDNEVSWNEVIRWVEQPTCRDCISRPAAEQLEKRTEERTKTHACVCISRQASIDAFERFIHELGIKDEPYNYGEMALSDQNVPSVEPERKTGKWLSTIRHCRRWIVCSQCRAERIYDHSKGWNYCPCCGAKMMEVDE